MLRSLTTAATGMAAQQRNLDTIANNLANVNTTAFKSSRSLFQDLMYQTVRAASADTGGGNGVPSSQQIGLGSKFIMNTASFSNGPLLTTGRDLDVAIQGNGFFQVQLADGSNAYTRDGAFTRTSAGLLVTNDGYPVGGNITIPSDATTISISPDGTVYGNIGGSSEPQVFGNIQLYIFNNPGGLERVGKNLFRASSVSGDATEAVPGQAGSGTLEQGFLEGSNVSMVDEMIQMIMAQRAYEVNSKAIMAADEMLNVTNQIKR
ncbi:MAG: flagellar basal-body rod protein FlgG [Fimbriimonadales bacterium]